MPGIELGTGVTRINQTALVLNMDREQGRQTQTLVITSPGRGAQCSDANGSGSADKPLFSRSALRMRQLQGEAPV